MGELQRIPVKRVRAYCEAIFQGLGVPADQAEIVADTLVEADLRGVESHGANNMGVYVSRLRAGHVRPRTEMRVLSDDGPVLQLDGGMGLGQVAGTYAVDRAVEKAREFGVAAVSVRESTHLGALAYYPMRAARAGVFALVFQNGPTIVPPFGGITPLFSTNPFAYAAPTDQEPMLVFDAAATAAAASKLALARKRGDAEIPADWVRDEQGAPTTDPQRASFEGLQWFGGHKGFGIAMLVEVLSGVLTNSSFGRTDITEAEPKLPTNRRIAKGYLFLALDVARFLPLDEFRARMDRLIRDVRSSEPAPGVERVYSPGERSHRAREERLRDGIPYAAGVIAELERYGADFGLGRLVG